MKRYIYMACLAMFAATVGAAVPADTARRISQFEQGLVPPVLVKGETPKLTPLADRMAELKVPGVSVAVIHQGRIEWARGYGVKSLGGAPVTEATLFQAASISKPLFALAVLHQVDAGKLNLDTNVNDYLKTWTLPDNDFTRDQKVTLKRILSHSAGLTVHGFAGYEAGAQLPTVPQILDGAPPANSEAIRVEAIPGTTYNYSGGGYTVAQLLLGDVTGQPLPMLMRDTVLTPLGMKLSTYEQPLPAARMGEAALPYRSDGSPVAGGPHVYPELAAAGMWTTPSDLARYGLGVRAALAGKSKIISAATARLMLTPVQGDHGIGPAMGGQTTRKFFGHSGGNEGYRCQLVLYEDGEGAVVMTNGDNGGGLVYQVMRTLATVYGWPDFGPETRTLATVKPEALDRLVGVYELEDKSLYAVRKNGAQLVGHIVGENPLDLYPSAENQVFARTVNAVATFTADPSGVITSVKHRVNGWERSGKRVDEARARQVLASVDLVAQRVKDQKADPRSEAALRKVVPTIGAGTVDLTTLSAELAELARQQGAGLQGVFGNLGELETITFQRVTERGADEYLVGFAKGKLRIEIGLDEANHIDWFYFEPR